MGSRMIYCLRAALSALALILLPTYGNADPPALTLPDYPGVSAFLDTQPDACPSTLPVTVKTRAAADLEDGKVVRKVMAWAQLLTETDCPDASAIRLTAYMNGQPVYKAIALRSDGWAMTEVRLEEPRPPSQATAPAQSGGSDRKVSVATDSLDVIRQCDERGAHPDDPEAVVKGIADDRLDQNSVIAACEAAVRTDKDTPRLRFQLARGYLKADRFEDAIEQLVPAAEQGHGGALAYLADFHVTGAPGIEADPALAHTLYEKAVASGFTPAKAVLAQFEDWTDRAAAADAEENQIVAQEQTAAPSGGVPSAKGYNNPKIVLAIYKGEFDSIPYGEVYTKAYVLHMAENIAAVCNAHFTSREVDELRNSVVMKQMDFSDAGAATSAMGVLKQMAEMGKNPGSYMARASQAEIDQKHMPEEAMKDAFKLMDSNPCNSPGLERFSQNLRSFVTDKGAQVASAETLMNTCMREARPSGRYRGKDFCLCFVGALKTNPVSRAQRKALASNFWPTAQDMMNKNSSFGSCHSGIGR